MGHSSLLGIDPAAAEPAGQGADVLGPSDSSDSGSDTAGTPRAQDAVATDSAGTGERRSAGRDRAQPDAPDIGADRVFSIDPGSDAAAGIDEAEDPDLAFIDGARAEDLPDDESPGEDGPGEDKPGEDRPGDDRPEDDKPVIAAAP